MQSYLDLLSNVYNYYLILVFDHKYKWTVVIFEAYLFATLLMPLLYFSDSCYLQVLLKQIEACLKCIEKQRLVDKAVETAQNLIILYTNVSDNSALTRDKSK